MATKLTKPVSRELERFMLGMKNEGPMIVTLRPGGVLTFRMKGRRTEMEVPLTSCYVLAAKAEANRAMTEAATDRLARRTVRRGKVN